MRKKIFWQPEFVTKDIINQPKLLEWVFEENRQIQVNVASESSLNHKIVSKNRTLESFKKTLSDIDDITKLINDDLEK